MELTRFESVQLDSCVKYLKVNQQEFSLITSIGLGFFMEIFKDLNSLESQNYLGLLYKSLEGVPEILSEAKLSNYYVNFTNFSQSLGKYENWVDVISNPSYVNLVYTIFYIFSGLYSKFMNFKILESLPVDLDLFKPHLAYFVEKLNIKVTFYKGLKPYLMLGSGLNIDILCVDSNNFALILSINTNVIKSQESKFIEDIFKYMSIPKSLEKFNKIIDIIKDYSKEYSKITPEMENILNIRKKWTCNHDLKTIKLTCDQKHCIQCLFEEIKEATPEKSRCKCGVILKTEEIEKVFKTCSPYFDRYFTCNQCNTRFKNSTSLNCEQHKTCINCRKIDNKKCFICGRIYDKTEIEEKLKITDNEIKILAKQEEKNEFSCIICTRKRPENEKLCKKNCDICKLCYWNHINCPSCSSPTQSVPNFKCVVCNTSNLTKDQVLKCKHPCHQACAKSHKCS